jgi:hypothetical protein
MGIDKDLGEGRSDGERGGLENARGPRSSAPGDLVRHVWSSSDENGPIVDVLLERANRILAKGGGRDCKRVLTYAEIDLLLAGNDPKDAA